MVCRAVTVLTFVVPRSSSENSRGQLTKHALVRIGDSIELDVAVHNRSSHG